MFVGEYGSFDEESYSSIIFSTPKNRNNYTINKEANDLSYIFRNLPFQTSKESKPPILSMKRSVGGSIEGKKDKEGTPTVEAEIHVNVKDDNGNQVSVSAEAKIQNDQDGKITTEGGFKVSIEKEFK